MNNKVLTIFCATLIFACPLSSEARGGFNGIITQIRDPRAMEAYAKEIQQLTELYEQGKKMQTQIEQLQQSLEHYRFQDLQQTYNFLAGTVDDFEKLQKNYVGMNITASEMKDNWNELNEDYDSKNMTPAELEKLKNKQEERRKASAEYRAKLLASIDNTEKAKEELKAYKQDLMLLETGKTSPVKAMQLVAQMMTHQANELKKSQQLTAEQIRYTEQKALEEQQLKKAREAKTKREADLQNQSLEVASKEERGVKYSSAIMTHDDFINATKNQAAKE